MYRGSKRHRPAHDGTQPFRRHGSRWTTLERCGVSKHTTARPQAERPVPARPGARDVGNGAVGTTSVVWGEVAGLAGRQHHQFVSRCGALGRPDQAAEHDAGVGDLVAGGWRDHRVEQRRWIHDAEQQVDVDRLGGEPGAHDVVARGHQFDAGTAHVGVQVAGAQRDCLAGFELDVVQQQRHEHCRVIRPALGEIHHQARFRSVACRARGDHRSERDASTE